MVNIGEKLMHLRVKNNISQKELADKLHVSKSAVSMYEAGTRVPGDEIKQIYCEYFDVDMNYLFGMSKHENSNNEIANIKKNNDELLDKLINNNQLKLIMDKTKDLTEEEMNEILEIASRIIGIRK